MQLINTLDSHLELEHDGVPLFRYVYRPQTPSIESPRPYFHPLRTLKGKVVSGLRPHDHRWHHGLSFTCAHLSGHNFWGGPTYVRGEGYRQLENNGRQKQARIDVGGPVLFSWLTWHTGEDPLEVIADIYSAEQKGVSIEEKTRVPWKIHLREMRSMLFDVHEGYWSLRWNANLNNALSDPLIWGSPTTQGRDNAGYGGLSWRGPRDFLGGQILMSEGREGPDLMGQKSPWLAYIGQHDESDDYSTLVFLDDPKNPRYPTPWFVRNTTPMVCPNFFFDEEYVQQPRETLDLNYKILIADGAWSRERIEAEVEKTA